MGSLKELEREIRKIKARNKKVETDKAWETSLTRKAIILVATYIVIVSFLLVSNIPNPWLNAVVPTAAFMLSTLTFPFFKQAWKKHVYKR